MSTCNINRTLLLPDKLVSLNPFFPAPWADHVDAGAPVGQSDHIPVHQPSARTDISHPLLLRLNTLSNTDADRMAHGCALHDLITNAEHACVSPTTGQTAFLDHQWAFGGSRRQSPSGGELKGFRQ